MSDAREKVTIKVDPKIPVAAATPSNSPVLPEQPIIETKSPEDATVAEALDRARRKQLIVTALERGYVNDRLKVELPPDTYGEWVRRDPFAIKRMEELGFRIDDTYSINRSLHSDGTGKPQIADVVFMTTSRDNKELIDEVKKERFLEFHAKKGRKAQEEKDLENNINKSTGGVIPAIVESQHREARKEEIAAALSTIQAQTTPRG